MSSDGVLVIGKTGQLATEMRRAAWSTVHSVKFLGRDIIDLAEPLSVEEFVSSARPRLVINAAAYTAVDGAESSRAEAFVVNCDGPRALADGCRKVGATLIHVSTDYVFDGSKDESYIETDVVNPLSVYGESKLEGERAIEARLDRFVTIRTSWVYSAFGRNFVKTMLRLGAERERLSVVDDQIGCPTSAADLARAIIAIAHTHLSGREEIYGTFHFCGQGPTSWYGFAEAIFDGARQRGLKAPEVLEPISTVAYPTPARRPRNSVLDCSKISRVYGITGRPWKAALAECLDELCGKVS